MMIAAFAAAALAACQPSTEVYQSLTRDFNESRVAAGLNKKGNVLEVWASPEGTWTALLTRPDGTSCIVDAGSGVAAYPMAAPGDPA